MSTSTLDAIALRPGRAALTLHVDVNAACRRLRSGRAALTLRVDVNAARGG
jgi:hypothetical protein